jgi:hypothetical protein
VNTRFPGLTAAGLTALPFFTLGAGIAFPVTQGDSVGQVREKEKDLSHITSPRFNLALQDPLGSYGQRAKSIYTPDATCFLDYYLE